MADQRRSRSPRRVRPQDAATIPPWREQRARSGPAQPMGNHVAARSLEQIFEGSGAGPAEHARPAPRLHTTVFQSLKRVVGNATHVPLTRVELSTASARGPGLKPPTGGKWPTCMEAISRCVAAYHHAVSAAEHAESLEIAANIGQYAHTLRQMLHGGDRVTADFLTLLHEWIENRALNMALRTTIINALQDDPFWHYLTEQDRRAAVDIVDLCQVDVRAKGERLRAAMTAMRA